MVVGEDGDRCPGCLAGKREAKVLLLSGRASCTGRVIELDSLCEPG